MSRDRKTMLQTPAMLFALCGCQAGPPPASGFLDDYASLSPDRYGDSSLLWWEEEDFDWTVYDRVLIDEPVVYYHPESKNRPIEPDELKKLTDYFEEAVREALGDRYPIVDSAGPGVLQIQAAITDLEPANPAVNVITSAVAFVPFDMGGAALEARFVDSSTGELVAMMVDRKRASPARVWEGYRGFTEWGYAKAAMRQWAAELVDALEQNP